MDLSQVIPIALSVLTTIIPAVWVLSTKIQKLHGALNAHSARIEEKISNLERQMNDVSQQLSDARKETNDLRERVVVVETRLSPSG